MTFPTLYILIWAAWTAWVQSIGRISLGWPSILLFDALVVGALFVSRKKLFQQPRAPQAKWSSRVPQVCWLAVPALASIVFTAIFQIPFDWDGMDYHLPPLVEAWKDGFWHHSVNPYVQARAYPKTAGMPFLWWITHFGSFTGLRGILLVPVLHWLAGLAILAQIFGRNKWVFLFWCAFPLVARGAVTAYADLPALTTLLAFALFALRGRYVLAGLALALHGSTKFTHLVSAAGSLVGLMIWWRAQGKPVFKRAQVKALIMMTVIFTAAVIVQPVENILTEGKPFGALKCKLLGYDFCDGSVDPNDMVVAPSLDYPREQPWVVKVLRGWAPSQLIPGNDVEKGGAGWAWILPLITAFILAIRGRDYTFWKNLRQNREVFGAILILGVADLAIPAFWYARYHMALGCVLAMVAAHWMHEAESARRLRVPFFVSLALLTLQLLWIAPQRTWFLAKKPVENLSAIIKKGYPAHATHQADQRSIRLYGVSEKKITICGNRLRPVLAAYGADITNDVRWSCPGPSQPPTELIEGETRYWIAP